jgi:hypothetical protein
MWPSTSWTARCGSAARRRARALAGASAHAAGPDLDAEGPRLPGFRRAQAARRVRAPFGGCRSPGRDLVVIPSVVGRLTSNRRIFSRFATGLTLTFIGPARTSAAISAPETSVRQVMSNEQKVAIITGASQGIGAALVKAYRDRNYRVVATSRSIKPAAIPRSWPWPATSAIPAPPTVSSPRPWRASAGSTPWSTTPGSSWPSRSRPIRPRTSRPRSRPTWPASSTSPSAPPPRC